MNPSWRKLFIRRECDLSTVWGVILTAHKYIWRFTNGKKEYLFAWVKDRDLHYFMHDLDEFAFGRWLYKKYFNTPSDIQKSYKRGLKFLKYTKHVTARLQEDLQNKNDWKKLLEAAFIFKKDFEFVNDKYSIMPWWALEAWQKDYQVILNSLIIKRQLAHLQRQILAGCTKPWKSTAVAEIQSAIKRGQSPAVLAEKYQFLSSWTVIWHNLIDKKWIKLVGQQPIKKTKALSHKQIIKLLKPNKMELSYIKMAPHVIFFKDWRDDLRRKHAYYWRFLWQSIAKKFSVTPDDLGYFTLPEIINALRNKKINNKELRTRKKSQDFLTLVQVPKLELKILSRTKLKKYNQVIRNDQAPAKNNELYGIVAQPGKLKGKVKIVRHARDLAKVRNGDILVANTTHPNYLMAMRKAAGFVTDEGGIASHAAIVAREFHKPCIVGTKIATKALKDGDLVEVDANKGIVKILKRK